MSRFEALRSGTTPLVGRDEELELLLRRWQQAKAGEGRVVLVSGEPGIGKSRLAAALSERIGTEPHTRLRYFCSPHHQDSALYPFIVQLERAAGFRTRRHGRSEARQVTGTARARGMRDDEDMPCWPNCCRCRVPPRTSTSARSANARCCSRRCCISSKPEARRRPVLMVFEDAHWIDPTSRELLDLTLDRVRRLPVLLVDHLSSRVSAALGRSAACDELALNRLGGRDGAALVKDSPAMPALAAEIVDEIVERTDGVPLFVEELTKAVLESAGAADRVAAVLAADIATALAVPATLHASLMARLRPARAGRQGGRANRRGARPRVRLRPDRAGGAAAAAELRAGLDRLTEAGLLFCRGVAPQSSYLFKHALVQDAAYGTLLRGTTAGIARPSRRRCWKQHFADLVERQPELLAHHLTAAGDTERAVDQWLKAGQHAAARLAHLEAIRHFDRGLATLAALPEGPARDGREIELQLARGLSLFTAEGYSSAGGGRGLCPGPRACRAAGRSAPAVHGSLRPLAIGQRCRQGPRLPQIVEPAAATDRGQGGRRIASAGASQRLGDLFVRRRAGSRARALRGGAPAL